MIFRTGSVLIVGNCDEQTLNKVYLFIVDLLKENCEKIKSDIKIDTIKPKKKKYRKRIVLFTE